MDKLAFVIVNFNGKEDTYDLLRSLGKIKRGKLDLKTILVDNGSEESIVRDLKEDFPDVDVLQTGTNLGFAGGYNAGMKYAFQWGAKWVLIINNDVMIKDIDLAEKLVETANSDSKVGLVSSKILFAPGYEFHKDRYEEKDKGKIIWYAGGSFDWNNLYSVHRGIDEKDEGQYDLVEETGFVSGCCLLIKREVLETVGYFDEKLFAYFEDNDYMMRVKKFGYRLMYDGRVAIYHKVSKTAGIGSDFTDYLLTRNRLEFARKYANLRTQLAVGREAIRQWFSGREGQKRGVRDFVKGKFGMEIKKNGNPEWSKRLSIVIVNFNTNDLLERLLESIHKKDSGFDSTTDEIIVVDNASVESVEKVIGKYKQIKFIQNDENTGFARANNQGIDYSLGKYVVLINSDIVVRKQALGRIVESAEMMGGNGAIAGKLHLSDGTIQKSVFKLPTLTGAVKEYWLGQGENFFSYSINGRELVEVEGAVMAAFLIPRKIISEIGKLDETNKMYFEDVEYCKRLSKSGFKIYYDPSAEFDHLHGASAGKLPEGKPKKLLEEASRNYHGGLKYSLITAVLWSGQKLRKLKGN